MTRTLQQKMARVGPRPHEPKKEAHLTCAAVSITAMNPQVDRFFRAETKWRDEFGKLRTIILGCGLTEELKWGKACYAFEGANVVIIQGFKEYCALLFFKGVLLKDTHRILIRQTEHVQSGRQIRFTHVREIARLTPVLKAYIREAVAVEQTGLKVKMKTTADFKVPGEFQERLDESPALKAAFGGLTPGRQRAYLFYFGQAKQSKTRAARVAKCMPQILKGKGLLD